MNPLESVERIASHFSSISQEYPAVSIDRVNEEVRSKINSAKSSDVPYISRWQVEKILRKTKKNSFMPGDIPGKLMTEFCHELSSPLAEIFSNLTKSFTWPAMWKKEAGIPLKKKNNVMTESNLRVISLTHSCSKGMEEVVIQWLLQCIGEFFDKQQFGGRKGSSITHYLIELVNFILYNLDLRKNLAVLSVFAYFKNGFNRVDHSRCLEVFFQKCSVQAGF